MTTQANQPDFLAGGFLLRCQEPPVRGLDYNQYADANEPDGESADAADAD